MITQRWRTKHVEIPENIARDLKLDFEIKLFKSVVQQDPDHVDALFSLGDSYTKKGLFEEGLAIDKQLADLLPGNDVVHYNLACSYSLLKECDSAFESLEKALELGYDEFEFMEDDPDLDNIRLDPRFTTLIDQYREWTA